MKPALSRRWKPGAKFRLVGGDTVFTVARVTRSGTVVFSADYDETTGTRKADRVWLYQQVTRGRIRHVA
jgi:hypothetical protein